VGDSGPGQPLVPLEKAARQSHLSYYGPLSLLGLFATWAFLLILGSRCCTGRPVRPSTLREKLRRSADLYLSGTTFFTLGLGDVTPRTALAKAITVAEGGTGFGFLGS
jgi:hypothetical protein